MLVECWRRMTIVERVEMVSQMNSDVEMLVVSGIAAQRPGVSPAEIRHELASSLLGEPLSTVDVDMAIALDVAAGEALLELLALLSTFPSKLREQLFVSTPRSMS